MDPRLMIGPYGVSLTQTGATSQSSNTGSAAGSSSTSFENLFQQAVTPQESSQFRISAHAQKRLSERNIDMNQELESSINSAFNELAAKGAKDSLVVTNEGAFVVNVPSRTMVTAMGVDEMRSGLVTNIDSVSMKYA